jgi:hypothetical protein
MNESPCSVPDWLRFAIPIETPRQQGACRRHDTRYLKGGDRRARFLADLCFALDLVGVPADLLERLISQARWNISSGAMDVDDAERYFWGVRQYGCLFWPGGDAPGALPPTPPETPEAA